MKIKKYLNNSYSSRKHRINAQVTRMNVQDCVIVFFTTNLLNLLNVIVDIVLA